MGCQKLLQSECNLQTTDKSGIKGEKKTRSEVTSDDEAARAGIGARCWAFYEHVKVKLHRA